MYPNCYHFYMLEVRSFITVLHLACELQTNFLDDDYKLTNMWPHHISHGHLKNHTHVTKDVVLFNISVVSYIAAKYSKIVLCCTTAYVMTLEV